MQFQEVPDTISLAIGRLSAAFPRFKLAGPTAAILREKMLPYPASVIERAVKALEESEKGFGSSPISAMVSALKTAAALPDATNTGHSLRSAELNFERLSIAERRAYTHAIDVLHAADHARRNVRLPQSLAGLQLNQEMLAHGIQISQNGEKLTYHANKILAPEDCPFATVSA